MASYPVFIVLRKETAFPHCRATQLWTGVETERLFSGVLGDDCQSPGL